MLEIGSLVDGKYKILNQVGHGGMSVVYLAMNEKANKQWAVKEVRKDGIKDFEVVKQSLVAETDMLKRLNHPNLPSIIDVIEDEERFLIVMDYIEGNSLEKLLLEYGAQPQEDVIFWAKQLCDVLGYLHTRTPAIIYRDMKPANIMLKPDGNVTLIDFGTAREFKEKNLADTTCLGTIGYAAPEQFGGMGQTDGRTDIYCLGATLYHLVTGMNPCEPPYEIRPIREINPALSGGLEDIILKCTKKDPNERYQSAAELMYALENYDLIDNAFRKKQKRRLATVIVTGVLSIGCAVTSAWGYIQANKILNENYEHLVKTGKYKDAIAAIPGRKEAYLELAESLLTEDPKTRYKVLSEQDAQRLIALETGIDVEIDGYNTQLTDIMDQLLEQDREGYIEVWNQYGEYVTNGKYSDEERRYEDMEKCYRKVVDTDKEKIHPEADAFCKLSSCFQSFSRLRERYGDQTEQSGVIRSDDTAEYKEVWETIKELNDLAKEDVREYDLEIRKHLVSILFDGENQNDLIKSNAVTEEELIQFLTQMRDDMNDRKYTSNREEIRKSLGKDIDKAIEKLTSQSQ